jgi:hypothetical protein
VRSGIAFSAPLFSPHFYFWSNPFTLGIVFILLLGLRAYMETHGFKLVSINLGLLVSIILLLQNLAYCVAFHCRSLQKVGPHRPTIQDPKQRLQRDMER